MENLKNKIIYPLGIQTFATILGILLFLSGRDIVFYFFGIMFFVYLIIFFFGYYFLQLKKTIINVLNLSKKNIFIKGYAISILKYFPLILLFTMIGIYINHIKEVILILSYVCVNGLLIGLEWKNYICLIIFLLFGVMLMIAFIKAYI